jgi:hypothetical protein
MAPNSVADALKYILGPWQSPVAVPDTRQGRMRTCTTLSTYSQPQMNFELVPSLMANAAM